MAIHRVLIAALALSVVSMCANATLADDAWTAVGGSTTLELNLGVLEANGLSIAPVGDVDKRPASWVFPVSSHSTLNFVTTADGTGEFTGGAVHHTDGLALSLGDREVRIESLEISVAPGSSPANFEASATTGGSKVSAFDLKSAKAGFSGNAKTMMIEVGHFQISTATAAALGDMTLQGLTIGAVKVRALAEWGGGDSPVDTVIDTAGDPRGSTGPDVIVADLPSTTDYNRNATHAALAVGTTSCNIGTEVLLWQDFPSVNHPVIGQNCYCLVNGRLTQLGASWLKHGFVAINNGICGQCDGQTGSVLGLFCSDPYGSGLNSGPGLGARIEVNPVTGAFPPTADQHGGHSHSPIAHGCQVRHSDFEVPGARFFIEGHYIAADDHAAGNANNNASYRELNVSGSSSNWNFTNAGPTVQQTSAIFVWGEAGAQFDTLDPPLTDGRIVVASKTTDLGGGNWLYDYAVYNMNSDRSVGSFSVPVGGANITNIGFNGTFNHDEGYTEDPSNAAWTHSNVDGVLTWTTDDFNTNQMANAIRWGTTYNFWFEADVEPSQDPGDEIVTIGYFKPGTPATQTATAPVPTPAAVRISIDGGAPFVLPPCTQTMLNVTIEPGSENPVPGSASIKYRDDGGAFQTLALTHMGGNSYEGFLPKGDCGGTPEFYIEADGDGGTTETMPGDAPGIVFTPAPGIEFDLDLVDEDFESGIPGGWTVSGLWNATSSCGSSQTNCENTGSSWAYFGQAGSCDYATGAQAVGSMSVTVNVPVSRLVTMSYCSTFERENFAMFDWPNVTVNSTDVIDEPAIHPVSGQPIGSSPWETRTIDLTAYAGQTITIDFNFDSFDAFGNNFKGWQIDDLKVTAIQVDCVAACGDLNDDGITNGLDLQMFVDAALISSTQPGDLVADFTGNGVVDEEDGPGMVEAMLSE